MDGGSGTVRFSASKSVSTHDGHLQWQLPGHSYIQQLLKNGHPRRIHEVLRMSTSTFDDLASWLVKYTNLKRLEGRGCQTSRAECEDISAENGTRMQENC